MRRIVTTCVLAFLLLPVLSSHSVRAASVPYNDPHGQWSLLLPGTYTQSDDHYHVGDEEHPGFTAVATLNSLTGPSIAVGYAECCRPELANLKQRTQADFDQVLQANPDAKMDANGIQPTMLGGQPAMRYDYFATSQGYRLHGRDIIAYSGGLIYGLRFVATDTLFDAAANDITTITDSFRFFGRSVADGVYNDPQGRFTFAVPPQYILTPNFFDEASDRELSAATLSPNPMADGNADPHMVVETFPDTMSFDSRFDVYANAGVRAVTEKGGQLGPSGVRHTMLDAHPAGIMDYYSTSDSGVVVPQ